MTLREQPRSASSAVYTTPSGLAVSLSRVRCLLTPLYGGSKKGVLLTPLAGGRKRAVFGPLPGGSRGGPGGPPGGPRRRGGPRAGGAKICGNFWGVCHSYSEKVQHLSRLGELLNTLENVHPRAPGPPGDPPRGGPGSGGSQSPGGAPAVTPIRAP